MEQDHFKDKLIEKALAVVKNNIDDENIKKEIFSLNLAEKHSSKPDYIKVSINRDEYDEALQMVMDYFIEQEWYEDCVEVKEYQEKLNELQEEQNNNTDGNTSRTNTTTVEA